MIMMMMITMIAIMMIFMMNKDDNDNYIDNDNDNDDNDNKWNDKLVTFFKTENGTIHHQEKKLLRQKFSLQLEISQPFWLWLLLLKSLLKFSLFGGVGRGGIICVYLPVNI